MSILDEPAFPIRRAERAADLLLGLSLRMYAAIHLCVPESGDDELDAMIRKAQRQRFAGTALVGMYLSDEMCRQNVGHGDEVQPLRTTAVEFASSAYQQADAMIVELEKP